MFEGKTVVCFGIGRFFNSYVARLCQRVKIHYVCDNDSIKWNKRFSSEEILCISPNKLTLLKHLVVIITVDDISFITQIKEQLDSFAIEH